MVRLADVQPGQGAASEIENVKRRGVAHELTVDSLPHKRDAAAFIPTVKAGFYGEIERFTCHCKAVRSRKQRGRVRIAVGRHGDGQAECDSKRGGQRPEIKQLRVLGNERLTSGGQIKRAKPKQKSIKKRQAD